MGRTGPLGQGLTLDQAERLADVSGGDVWWSCSCGKAKISAWTGSVSILAPCCGSTFDNTRERVEGAGMTNHSLLIVIAVGIIVLAALGVFSR